MISLCALSIVCAVCMWVANARAIVGALVNEIRALKLIFVCDFTSCRCKVLATKLDTTVFVLLFFFVPPKIKPIIIIFVSCCDTWSPSKNNNTHTHTVCACNCSNANATDETRRADRFRIVRQKSIVRTRQQPRRVDGCTTADTKLRPIYLAIIIFFARNKFSSNCSSKPLRLESESEMNFRQFSICVIEFFHRKTDSVHFDSICIWYDKR